ncbi:MAG: DUF4292 domain-containing protein [Bacteroidota bacterium]|nr:DUF4292 domain-containing protein [Bacteroidota bacterium]
MNKTKLYICQLTVFALFVFLTLFFHACKTSRIAGTSYPNITINELLNAHDTSYVNANILDLRFKAKYTDSTSGTQRATCYIRMYTDSLIWVSVRYMNIEGMRMLLTPDSLQFVDRVNKYYYQGNYDYFSRTLMLTPGFFTIQDVLLQKMVVLNPHYQQDLHKKIKPCKDSIYYCLKLNAEKPKDVQNRVKVFSPGWVEQRFRFYPSTHKLASTRLLSILTGDEIQIEYSTNHENNDQYPASIVISLTGQQYVRLELQNKKAACGDSLKTPFKIPENYEPVRF